jgi:tetratricopeptide (TPR) repeat protein
MGGWYLQPDCNMPSGESFVRQILLGRAYFKKYFGATPTVAINFDPFGHTRGLAQILAKSGYKGYLFCRPEQHDCPLPANTVRWVEMTKSLRAFYYDYKVFGEALALDERVHYKLNSADSAAALGETQLELKMNEEAAAFLGALDEERTSPRSQVLLGVALARLDRMNEAEKIASECKPPKEPDAAYFLDMACLCALLGETDDAAKNLRLCFEHTPPSLLDAAKDRARAREDLNGLANSAEYEKVWLTASKIKESDCSGGTSCGACPSAATCTSGDKGGK